MICRYHALCNSETCPNRKPHPHDAFCSGGRCSWGDNTFCVPESTRELVEALIKGNDLIDLSEDQVVDRIVEIFEGQKKEVAV